MITRRALVIGALATPAVARAQNSLMTWESAGGAHCPQCTWTVTNFGRAFQLPGWAPDPATIVSGDMLIEGATNGLGRPMLLNDPGGVYHKAAWGMGAAPTGVISELPWFAPTSNRALRRVVVLDLNRGETRRIDFPNPPIRHSRSEGDMLMLDKSDQGPGVWFAHTIAWQLGIAPPYAYGTGSWGLIGNGSAPPGSGRTIVNDATGRSKLMFGFTALANGEITCCQIRVNTLRARDSVTMQLWSLVNGMPSAPIGCPSWPWLIGMAGEQQPQWPVGCGAITLQGGRYGIVMSMVNGTLDADFDVHVGVPANTYTSGRGDVITSIGNNLPSGEIWRAQIDAIGY